MQERIMNGFRSKMRNKKENNKGFTLVELIVVIVILAILAALLVPALVGWIDKAREKTYAVEARTVYLAAQTLVSENYMTSGYDIEDNEEDVKKLSGVNVSDISGVSYARDGETDQTAVEKRTIVGITVTFIPANESSSVTMKLENNQWSKVSTP